MRTKIAAGAFAAVSIAMLGWQSWTLAGVNGRLSVLEQLMAADLRGSGGTAAAGTRDEPDRQAVDMALKAWKSASAEAQGQGLSKAETAEMMEAALERAFERKTAENKAEATEKWIAMATENIELELEELVADYDIPEASQVAVVDLLVGGMHDGIQLKRDVRDGDISLREAKAEGQALQDDFLVSLTELIGEEAADELGERLKPGEGWGGKRQR